MPEEEYILLNQYGEFVKVREEAIDYYGIWSTPFSYTIPPQISQPTAWNSIYSGSSYAFIYVNDEVAFNEGTASLSPEGCEYCGRLNCDCEAIILDENGKFRNQCRLDVSVKQHFINNRRNSQNFKRYGCNKYNQYGNVNSFHTQKNNTLGFTQRMFQNERKF